MWFYLIFLMVTSIVVLSTQMYNTKMRFSNFIMESIVQKQ